MNYDFLESMPLDNIIPMLQVFYILTVVLDTIKDEDKTILQELVFKLINFLKLNFSLVFQQVITFSEAKKNTRNSYKLN